MIKIEAGQEVILVKFGKKYIAGKPIYVWANEIEDGAMEQMLWASNHPCLFHHAAAMPDVHQGYGLPIGGVVGLHDGVSPFMVGRDKGCGVRIIRTNIKCDDVSRDEIIELRRAIRKLIPMGGGKAHDEPQKWKGFDDYASTFTFFYSKDNRIGTPEWLTEKAWNWIKRTMGTLGGGKMIASGPRG